MAFNIQQAIDDAIAAEVAAAHPALKADVDRLNIALAEAITANAILQTALDVMKNDLDAKKLQLMETEQDLNQANATINDLRAINTQLADDKVALTNTVAARDAVISGLRDQVAAKDAEIATLKARIATLEAAQQPAPPPPPPPPPPPTTFAWPDATNTGPAAGTAFTAYTGPSRITTAGTLIEKKRITSPLQIDADNVTIRDCEISFNGFWGIDANPAGTRRKNLRVERCKITGPGSGGTANAAINAQGTFLNNNISNCENGIVLDIGSSTVKGNYIHDLLSSAGNSGHYDGISVQTTINDTVIEDNVIVGWDTSCIFIKSEGSSQIRNITVNHNKMLRQAGKGLSECLYADTRSTSGSINGVKITNNVCEKGSFNSYFFVAGATNVTVSGNVDATTGVAITDNG